MQRTMFAVLLACAFGCGRPPAEDTPVVVLPSPDTSQNRLGAATPAKVPPVAVGKETITIPFSDPHGVVVNLVEERASRFLKVRITLSVDVEAEKVVTEKLAIKKGAMKSWLLIHLAGKTLKDVSGPDGMKCVQREILEMFRDLLGQKEEGPLRNIEFAEFVIQ